MAHAEGFGESQGRHQVTAGTTASYEDFHFLRPWRRLAPPMLMSTPVQKRDTMRLVRPCETNGSGSPVVGTNESVTAMCSSATMPALPPPPRPPPTPPSQYKTHQRPNGTVQIRPCLSGKNYSEQTIRNSVQLGLAIRDFRKTNQRLRSCIKTCQVASAVRTITDYQKLLADSLQSNICEFYNSWADAKPW